MADIFLFRIVKVLCVLLLLLFFKMLKLFSKMTDFSNNVKIVGIINNYVSNKALNFR